MRRLELTEGEPARSIELTDSEAQALAASELASIDRAPGDPHWSVAPGRKVGVLRTGAVQISVRPKIPVERLVFLMGYASAPKFWRDHTVHLDHECGLPEALAHTFARLATKATDQGLLQGYWSIDDSLPVLRGRVRVPEQISRRFGAVMPLEVTYDDFTIDIAENRLLLAAATRLLRLPSLDTRTRQRLQRLRLLFSGVSEMRRGETLPRWQPTRLNARYQPSLQLAERILVGESFEQRRGPLNVDGFVFDMWSIYEDFVGIALTEALASHGSASLQHQMHLDRAKRVSLRPDILWTSHVGDQVVVDAKYKAEKPAGYPQVDLYQLLAYCTALGLREGHLVYAKGNEAETVHEVQGADIAIHCHTVDLDQPPTALLEQMHTLAHRIASPSSRRPREWRQKTT